MRRFPVIAVCCAGWIVLVAGVAAPLVGMVLAAGKGGAIRTDVVHVPPAGRLLITSVVLAAIASVGSLLLGILPGAVLGTARGVRQSVVRGMVLAPLLIPPQVYAYAWSLLGVPQSGLYGSGLWTSIWPEARAGVISACWLWPVTAMIVAAGWQGSGRGVYRLARMDAGPVRAVLQAVLPAMRPHLVASACVVFVIAMIEYPIPHLTQVKVYATELLVLVDVGAPPGQVMRMTGQVVGILLPVVLAAALSLRGIVRWQPLDLVEDVEGAGSRAARCGGAMTAGAGVIWLVSLALPAAIMVADLRVPGAWKDGFKLLTREWLVSAGVSVAAGLAAVTIAVGTVLLGSSAAGRTRGGTAWTRIGAAFTGMVAVFPPAALGIGFIVIFNRAGWIGDLYTQTPVVWCLALVARYGAILVLVVWLATSRRGVSAAEQAMTDGADRPAVLSSVLLPMASPYLAAGAIMVAVLAFSEVVVSQLVAPVGYPSIAIAILGHMHYGRVDMVITTSLILMAGGVVLTQVCGHLLGRNG